MNEFDAVIAELARKSEKKEAGGDYRRDGLLHCGTCGMPKQCRVEYSGKLLTVSCMCQCEEADWEREKQVSQEEQRRLKIKKLRVNGIHDRAVRGYTFSDAQPSKNISRCRKYVDRWPEMLAHNNGLLFWGDVGTGKTFAAACIANALIDHGVPVLMTSFPKILNSSGWDKAELIGQMKHFRLLIIDDLGAERESDYALETVQYVVDERYKTGKPLIITTNLTKKEMENPKDMRFSRIYDRVLEMCVPVYFDGPSNRKKAAEKKICFAREVLK